MEEVESKKNAFQFRLLNEETEKFLSVSFFLSLDSNHLDKVICVEVDEGIMIFIECGIDHLREVCIISRHD